MQFAISGHSQSSWSAGFNMGAHEFGTLKCIFVFHPAKISSDRVQTNMGLDEGILYTVCFEFFRVKRHLQRIWSRICYTYPIAAIHNRVRNRFCFHSQAKSNQSKEKFGEKALEGTSFQRVFRNSIGHSYFQMPSRAAIQALPEGSVLVTYPKYLLNPSEEGASLE